MDPLKILMLYIILRGWKRQTKWLFSPWPHRGVRIHDLTRLPSSSISLKMVCRPSLLARVRGVRFTLFLMSVLAGSLWCLTMYLYISYKIKGKYSIVQCYKLLCLTMYLYIFSITACLSCLTMYLYIISSRSIKVQHNWCLWDVLKHFPPRSWGEL